MANFTATNIQITRTELNTTPPGNKAVVFGFSADILLDGVMHHTYSEPQVSVGQSIPQIIQNHLNAWNNSKTVPTTLPPIDMTPPPPPTPDTALAAFQAHLTEYKAQVGLVQAEFITKLDPAFTNAKAAVSADLAAHPEYKIYFVGF